MKKIAIITLVDDYNFGNRLQNYALQSVLQKLNFEVDTLRKSKTLKYRIKMVMQNIISLLKKVMFCKKDSNYRKKVRHESFINFNEKYIHFFNYSVYSKVKKQRYYKYIIGSDQILSPLAVQYYPIVLTPFLNEKSSVILYAPSLGVSVVDQKYINQISKAYNNDKICGYSVREDKGKEILNKIFPGKEIEVLIDPTLLLSSDEWDELARRPTDLKNNKYILTYFLGNVSKNRKNEIEKVAVQNHCEVINLLDQNDKFYGCGPSEFLYLIKNSFLICTDSFHSAVFSLIYNRPFVVFDREEEKLGDMSSRIDTLINKFQLTNRKYNGKYITEQNLKHDYSKAYKILEYEKEKSYNFLEKALNVKDSE